jgi:hypothetical protein
MEMLPLGVTTTGIVERVFEQESNFVSVNISMSALPRKNMAAHSRITGSNMNSKDFITDVPGFLPLHVCMFVCACVCLLCVSSVRVCMCGDRNWGVWWESKRKREQIV